MNSHKHSKPDSQAGFTLIEATVSIAMFAIILFGGVVISANAAKSLRETGKQADEQISDARDRLEMLDVIGDASQDSLMADPGMGGGLLEPMLDNWPYTNIAFRHVTAYGADGPVTDPPALQDPYRMYMETGGDLVLMRGNELQEVIMSDVRYVMFIRENSKITFYIYKMDEAQGGEVEAIVQSVTLRAP